MRGLGSPTAESPTPAPPLAVRNGSSGGERLRPPESVLVMTRSAERSPRVTGPTTGARRPRNDGASLTRQHRAPSARSPEHSWLWRPRPTPPDPRCTAPCVGTTREPCGWQKRGSVTPSVCPSVWGSLLSPLLSGRGVRTRPRTQRPLHPRQWRTPTVLVIVHDCFDFSPAAADHGPVGHGRGVVADRS